MMRVATNIAAMKANREIQNISREKITTLGHLASGERIVHAADDPAGLAISESMKAKSRSKDQAQKNCNDAISFVQVAEGSLGTMQSLAIRLKELALQASTDTLGYNERELVDLEFQGLKQEIKRIGYSSEFNGKKLLENSSRYDMQIDTGSKADSRLVYNLNRVFESINNIGLNSLDVSDKIRARSASEKLDSAMNRMSEGRSQLGALQNRMGSVLNNLEIANENISAAKSRIRDADMAEETAKKISQDLRTDVSATYMVHAIDSSKLALRLLS